MTDPLLGPFIVVAATVIACALWAVGIGLEHFVAWRTRKRLAKRLPRPDASTKRFTQTFERDWKVKRGSDTDWRSAA